MRVEKNIYDARLSQKQFMNSIMFHSVSIQIFRWIGREFLSIFRLIELTNQFKESNYVLGLLFKDAASRSKL